MGGCVGVYGKIPEKGDFILRNVSRDFVRGWDDWMGRSILAAKERLADDWLESYLTSPIWRFALPGGLFGASGWAGVFIPSLDRVQRQFPLTLVTELQWPAGDNVMVRLGHLNPLFDEMEEAALVGLADRLDLERYFGLLDCIETPALPPLAADQSGDAGSGRRLVQGEVIGFDWPDGVGLPAAARSILDARSIWLQDATLCAWGTTGSAVVPPQICISQGAPAPESFVRFITSGFLNGASA